MVQNGEGEQPEIQRTEGTTPDDQPAYSFQTTYSNVVGFSVQRSYPLSKDDYNTLKRRPRWASLPNLFLGAFIAQALVVAAKLVDWVQTLPPRPVLFGDTIKLFEVWAGTLALIGFVALRLAAHLLPSEQQDKIEEIKAHFREHPADTEYRQT